MATDPKFCERCGQGDCPTLGWKAQARKNAIDQDARDDARDWERINAWTAAFHACGTVRGARSLETIEDLMQGIRTFQRVQAGR